MTSATRTGPVRCAIYTRKSSEEGLEQAFNSLDAQREACAAYIMSQASEGWTALPDIYNDGGLSGGTLERPALKRMLSEVAAGRIDIIVVYKVDRLTRSLFDFAKLVETFDKAGTSFVSVTQSFNTTTSMGRLTLNMLLSFAQFEREVTAERIRDKIAASKARGMWMGGVPPLGYAPNGRSLTIVEEHAALIRHLFNRYLALGSVRLLEADLADEGITVPRRTSIAGNQTGGGAFTRGQLYQILKNVTYAGQIGHKGKAYSGQHDAIIARELFDEVRATLAGNIQGHRTRARVNQPSLLAGRIKDGAGEPLVASHACKGARRYRYYISEGLQTGNSRTGHRIPALEVEQLVVDRLAQFIADPLVLIDTASLDVPVDRIVELHWRTQELAGQLRQPRSQVLRRIVSRVTVGSGELTIVCDLAALAEALQLAIVAGVETTLSLPCPARLTRSGRTLRLVQNDGVIAAATPDASLLRLLGKARTWWAILRTGEVSPTELAERLGVTRSYITRVVRLAFLSPAVTEAILTGRQRAGVTVASLVTEGGIMADWNDQKAAMLPG